MSYYYKLGRIPHKRHTQFRQPDGSLYHEELMGIRGFVGDKSLLYHLRPPTDVREIDRGCEVKIPYAEPGPVQHRLLRTADVPSGGDAVTGRVPLMANSDVCISVARPQQPMTVLVSLRARRRNDLRSRRNRAVRKPVRHAAIQAGRLSGDSDRRDVAHRSRCCGRPAHAHHRKRWRPHRAAPALRQPIRTVSRKRTVCRARHSSARRAGDARRGRGVRGSRQGARVHRALSLRPSSARRRRLGRAPVAVCVQHRRLRADYRTRAPAAAGASDVRRARLRDLFVRAALVRLSPALDPGALQPLERRLGRSHLLREGGLHVAPGHCLGGAHGAPQRHPARAASRYLRGLDRQGTDRRAGGHGRHVPPACAHDSCGCHGGPELPIQLERRHRMADKNFDAFKQTIEERFMHHPVGDEQRLHAVVRAR